MAFLLQLNHYNSPLSASLREKQNRGKRAQGSRPEGGPWEQASSIGSSDELSTHLRSLFKRDLVAQSLQAAHRRVALAGGVQRLKEVGTQIVVVLLITQQVVDDDEQAVTHRDNGPLGPNAAGQAVILGREVVVLGMGDDPD